MEQLTKRYRVIYRHGRLVLPVSEEGMDGVTYPAADTEHAEFDTYAEAMAFIKNNNITDYEDGEYNH